MLTFHALIFALLFARISAMPCADCNTRIHKQIGGTCWAHAISAYIERAYCLVTCSKINIDTDRVIDVVSTSCAEHWDNPGLRSNGFLCAFHAVARDINASPNPWFPIALGDTRRICEDNDLLGRLKCAKKQVQKSPILALICEYAEMVDNNGRVKDMSVCDGINHAVIIVNIVTNGPDAEIIVQNSHGDGWGNHGYGTIHITVDNIINNHSPLVILDYMYVMDVSAPVIPKANATESVNAEIPS